MFEIPVNCFSFRRTRKNTSIYISFLDIFFMLSMIRFAYYYQIAINLPCVVVVKTLIFSLLVTIQGANGLDSYMYLSSYCSILIKELSLIPPNAEHAKRINLLILK